MKITILGGTSGFGKWLAQYIGDHFGETVTIVVTGSKDDNTIAVKDADIIIFSVPISRTVAVIKEVGPYIKGNAIVSDVTSVKQKPYEAMQEYIPQALILPTHPMFGPFIKSIHGQTIVLTPDEKTMADQRYKILRNILQAEGAKIIETTAKEHDHVMSIVQGLTHFGLFAMGETMRRMNVDIEFANQFASPVYQMMLSSVGRYAGQNPTLYTDIQANNPENILMHKIFSEVIKDFSDDIKDDNTDSFTNRLQNVSDYFGDNAQIGQKYTDKIIYLLSDQIGKIKENIGNKVTLENIYNKEKRIGIITDFDGKYITLDNNDKLDINERVIITDDTD